MNYNNNEKDKMSFSSQMEQKRNTPPPPEDNNKNPHRTDVRSRINAQNYHRTDVRTGIRTSTPPQSGKKKASSIIGKILLRTLSFILALLFAAVGSAYIILKAIATGPSVTIRDQLVLSAMQASATKWVPGLFLDDELVKEIYDNSFVIQTDVTPIDSYKDSVIGNFGDKDADGNEPKEIDGLTYFTINGPTYKAYVMIVSDPSRLYVATCDFNTGAGIRIFDMAEREGCVAAINAGEYQDNGGQGTGDLPIGITYSKGACVWSDWWTNRTFMGFDKNNKLIVKEGMTKSEAESLGIRDGVCFQQNNTLITNDGTSVTCHYAESNTGTAQRTAIGQRADGSIIMVVTDGRSASSLGATRNDIIDVMVKYGAITAGMLDGGSSSMLYYREYWNILGIDYNSLDQYQRLGIVNKYKAFTNPRKMPTYFAVAPLAQPAN